MNGGPLYMDKRTLAMDISVAVRRSLRGDAALADHKILSTLNDEIVDFAEAIDNRTAAIMKMIEQEKENKT